jgi:hypothetical protein
MKNNILNNDDNFKYGDKAQGFKTTYSGAEWYIETIYNFCYDVLNCYDPYDYYATQAKNALLKLGELIHTLADYSNEALQETYSYFLTHIAPDEERYYQVRDLANGEEEEYYVEPTFDDFIENITDCEYTYDYEDWNNTEEAMYILGEEIGYEIWNFAFDLFEKEVA